MCATLHCTLCVLRLLHRCVATLIIQLSAAYSFGSLVNRARHVAFFAIGAAGAFYGSYLVSESIAGMFGRVSVDNEHEILLCCAFFALLGGLIFGCFHEALLDTALGLLGGALLAQGLITLALADLLSEETVRALGIEAHYMFYVAGIAVPIELLRRCLVTARERRVAGNGGYGWQPQHGWQESPRKTTSPRLSPKLSPGRSSRVSPIADKARELSKRTPPMGGASSTTSTEWSSPRKIYGLAGEDIYGSDWSPGRKEMH